MRTLHDVTEVRRAVEALRRRRLSIGFVPTMGYLHEGHLSLIRQARRSCDKVIVSIYVNPIQFGPEEDLTRYPRDLQQDSSLCLEERVDLLLVPTDEMMYPEGFSTRVQVDGVSQGLCGDHRPGHFDGVATVVAKLLNMVRPNQAFFGEKDYQQLLVIRRMVQDLELGVEVVACPTVRESDGLAMSSRNARLTPADRKQAPALQEGLEEAGRLVEQGERNPEIILRPARERLLAARGIAIEYLEVRDAEDLSPVTEIRTPVVIAVAARLGDVRLIDNRTARPPEE